MYKLDDSLTSDKILLEHDYDIRVLASTCYHNQMTRASANEWKHAPNETSSMMMAAIIDEIMVQLNQVVTEKMSDDHRINSALVALDYMLVAAQMAVNGTVPDDIEKIIGG